MYPQPITHPDYSTVINLNSLRAWIQISDEEMGDEFLNELGLRVFSEIERRTNRILTERTYTLTMDGFYDYRIVTHPFNSITKVEYYGEDEVTHILEDTKYAVKSTSSYENSLIFNHSDLPKLGYKWNGDLVTVTMSIGYAEGAIPPVILSAAEHLARHYYDNKDNPKQEFPSLVDRMIKTFSIDAI